MHNEGWLLTTGEKKKWAREARIPVLEGRFAEAASAAEDHLDSLLALPPVSYLYDSHPELHAIRDRSANPVPLPLYEAWVKMQGAQDEFRRHPDMNIFGAIFFVTDVGLVIIAHHGEHSLILKKAKTPDDREAIAGALTFATERNAHIGFLTATVTSRFGGIPSDCSINLCYADLGEVDKSQTFAPVIHQLIVTSGLQNQHRTGSLDVVDAYFHLTQQPVHYSVRQVRPTGLALINDYTLPRGIVEMNSQSGFESLDPTHINDDFSSLSLAARGFLQPSQIVINAIRRNE